jgi:hypothetical protein
LVCNNSLYFIYYSGVWYFGFIKVEIELRILVKLGAGRRASTFLALGDHNFLNMLKIFELGFLSDKRTTAEDPNVIKEILLSLMLIKDQIYHSLLIEILCRGKLYV